jgi:hypothetical protein
MLTKKENIKNDVKTSKNGKNPSTSPESCCSPGASLNSQASPQHTSQPPSKLPQEMLSERKSSGKTRLTIKYDAGFPNQIFIRGKGANLSWEKGLLLKNAKPDEWVWETDAHFASCEFKVLINDRIYEIGENHQITAGSSLLYTPHF